MIAINKSNYKLVWKGLKISELCKMIESSIRSGKYPLEDQQQKAFANSVEVINRSDSEDLKSKDIKIEVRMQDLYTLNNYLPNIQHLPGVIETDVLDSFRMLCRRLGRVTADTEEIIIPNRLLFQKTSCIVRDLKPVDKIVSILNAIFKRYFDGWYHRIGIEALMVTHQNHYRTMFE